jgi:hypothetical protein
VEIAADAGLFHLHFAGTERFGRTDDGVIFGLIEILHEVGIEANFRCEELSVEHRVFVARSSVEPSKVTEGKRSVVIDSDYSGRRLESFRDEVLCGSKWGCGLGNRCLTADL